ncbi:MAG: histidine kinase [Bacteroidetes bacterium]|nr:MAG: histidine kinase [Bacteroidota bacterium]
MNPFYSFVNIYTVVGFFASIKLLKYWYHNQQLKSELENKNKTSELALLKSQVNPHFLFNTLNNIDSLVAIDQEKASDAIIKLSDIMRYMLYDTATDKVFLEKEINYLQSYIALQGLRFQNPEVVQFNISGSCSNFHIAPMLLIPFVENAFKHGKKTMNGAIIISLVCVPEKLVFTVSNKYDVPMLQQKDKTKGIGLSNVKRRLDLLYPDKYVLDINGDDGKYEVKLQIRMV